MTIESHNKIIRFTGEYRFLSSFYEAEFAVYRGFLHMYYPDVAIQRVTFPTVEHFYQAMKCYYYKDHLKVIECETPSLAKHMGRRMKIRPYWENIKISIMRYGIKQKFSQNESILYRLYKTGSAELVEGNNWHDTFWGVDINTGNGENHLGKLLMDVRSELCRNIRF